MISLNNTILVTISDIPVQWIPKIELYYPDLPQFPIMYLHSFCNGQRVLGVPVSVSYTITGTTCSAEFMVLTNVSQSTQIVTHISNEIKERIGLSQAIGKADVVSYCKNNKGYIDFFSDLWQFIEASYGSIIPYGKFFEEIYSIVRFVSAWTPKTGRQSEMRMLYNFMSAFGELAELPPEWSHLECYFIPTIADIRGSIPSNFIKFQRLFNAIEKTFNAEYLGSCSISGHSFSTLPAAWPANKDDFINEVTRPLNQKGILDDDERVDIETLVDAFNRHPWRAAFFISALITAKRDDYSQWDKQFFIEFYKNGSKLKGYSEKVIACFLQQGFLKDEIIPIDTWIETFYQYPLGISDKNKATERESFYNSFDHLGKLERVIWLASQANKTNMRNFFDVLWCQRFGTIGNGVLRGINPIACAECSLKHACVGLNNKKQSNILLSDNPDISSFPPADKSLVEFVCVLETDVPKKIYSKAASGRGKNKTYSWELTDEFSGYIMSTPLSKTLINQGTITMNDFAQFYNDISFAK